MGQFSATPETVIGYFPSSNIVLPMGSSLPFPFLSLKPKKLKKLLSTITPPDSINWLLPDFNLKSEPNTRQADFTEASCLGNCAPKAGPEGACENDSLSLLKVFDKRKIWFPFR